MVKINLLFSVLVLNNCKPSEISSASTSDCQALKLDYNYLAYEDTSAFFQQEYESYLKSNNTELLYFSSNSYFRNDKYFFRVIQTENEVVVYKKNLSESKQTTLTNVEKETFYSLFEKISTGNYIQKCKIENFCTTNLYLVLVKVKGKEKITYFSPFDSPSQLNPNTETKYLYELFLLIDKLKARVE